MAIEAAPTKLVPGQWGYGYYDIIKDAWGGDDLSYQKEIVDATRRANAKKRLLADHTRRLIEAAKTAKNATAFIKLEIEEDWVAVVGCAGEVYLAVLVPWEEIQEGSENPLLRAIATIEEHLA